jgi:hypothetical protein
MVAAAAFAPERGRSLLCFVLSFLVLILTRVRARQRDATSMCGLALGTIAGLRT